MSLYEEKVPFSTVTFSRARTSRRHIDETFVSFCECIVWPKTLNVEFSSACVLSSAVAFWPTSRSNGGMVDTEVVAVRRRSAMSDVVIPYVTSAWYDDVLRDSMAMYA